MRTCIYCLSPKDDSLFNVEHVIPQFLGTFHQTMTLGVVCTQCNSTKLSKLETIFKEDSIEGFRAAQYDLRNADSIRLRKQRLRWSVLLEGKPVNLFPFIDINTGKMMYRPHSRLAGRDDRELIIKAEELTAKQLKPKLKWLAVENAQCTSFDRPTKSFAEASEVIGTYSKVVESAAEVTLPEIEPENSRLTYTFDAQVDRTIRRVPAKIAYNYFAYCAIQSGFQEALYDRCFDKLRSYILDDDFENESSQSIVFNSRADFQLGEMKFVHGAPFHICRVVEERRGTGKGRCRCDPFQSKLLHRCAWSLSMECG